MCNGRLSRGTITPAPVSKRTGLRIPCVAAAGQVVAVLCSVSVAGLPSQQAERHLTGGAVWGRRGTTPVHMRVLAAAAAPPAENIMQEIGTSAIAPIVGLVRQGVLPREAHTDPRPRIM
jgi:hypothetical protein